TGMLLLIGKEHAPPELPVKHLGHYFSLPAIPARGSKNPWRPQLKTACASFAATPVQLARARRHHCPPELPEPSRYSGRHQRLPGSTGSACGGLLDHGAAKNHSEPDSPVARTA